MRCLLLCVLWLLSPVIVAQAVAAEPYARLVAESDAAIEVGASIYVRYEVWVPSWFFGSPSFPDELGTEGALSEMIKGSPTSEFRDIGDQRWTGLIRRYRVTPWQAGSLRLQPPAVDVRYAGDAAQARQARISVAEPLWITARIPPEAQSLKPFVAARTLNLAQTVTPAGVEIRVGDIVERTVSLVTDSLSPSLTVVPLGPSEGPGIHDRTEQIHRLAATPTEPPLTERVVSTRYLISAEGERWLPEINLYWWDLHARQVRNTRLPAVRIEGLPARFEVDPFSTEPVSRVARDGLQAVWLSGGLGLLLTLVGTLLWRLRRGRWRWADMQPVCLWRLLQACRANDGATADAALRRWARAVAPGQEPRLLSDPDLAQERESLDKHRFSPPAPHQPWLGIPLYQAACSAGRRWRHSEKNRTDKRLPTLRP